MNTLQIEYKYRLKRLSLPLDKNLNELDQQTKTYMRCKNPC